MLREHGRALTVTDVAERVGLHPNTVRLHLDHMVEAGLATRELEHRDRPGRPRLLYAATAVEPGQSGQGGRGGQDGYRLSAEILASRLEDTSPQPGEIAAAAGRTWGADLARTLSPAAPVQITRLDPFVAAGLCLARLAPVPAGSHA